MTCHHFPSGNQSSLKVGYIQTHTHTHTHTHISPILRLLTQCPQLSRGLEHQSWCLYIPSICYKVRNFKTVQKCKYFITVKTSGFVI